MFTQRQCHSITNHQKPGYGTIKHVNNQIDSWIKWIELKYIHFGAKVCCFFLHEKKKYDKKIQQSLLETDYLC